MKVTEELLITLSGSKQDFVNMLSTFENALHNNDTTPEMYVDDILNRGDKVWKDYD